MVSRKGSAGDVVKSRPASPTFPSGVSHVPVYRKMEPAVRECGTRTTGTGTPTTGTWDSHDGNVELARRERGTRTTGTWDSHDGNVGLARRECGTRATGVGDSRQTGREKGL
ncbi:hypothetical protein Atai01_27050 [Amycolatopsis taiwanensis]|uniref:Uncharacterized protein n=1 Tax=Amycolatopsis taiwanensis TaxID=342230 RepID=A0A9W6QXZ3_9PSEU|nr:hypothetical protein Atai01_27050 [Amycolatopsis taiwanensis]